MTEPRLDELFTALGVHRQEMMRIASDLSQFSAAIRGENGVQITREQIAEKCDAFALSLGAQIESITHRVGAAMDETRPMNFDEVADD